MKLQQLNLFEGPESPESSKSPEGPNSPNFPNSSDSPLDQSARDFAIDPANVVVLEASAGTGKTRVLVDRYVRLLAAGVDPRNILAVTFTRKAAAEMRDRVLVELTTRAAAGGVAPARWRALRERIAEIQISTIDAFCFGLLREFPLEANVDPAFEIADETEIARLANVALDLTFRAARRLIVSDENVRLLLTRVKLPILRDALAALIDRRHIAIPAIATFVKQRTRCQSAAEAGDSFIARLRSVLDSSPHRRAVLDDGPIRSSEFLRLREDLANLDKFPAGRPAQVQLLRRRLERYFQTKSGEPRQKLSKPYLVDQFASADARKRHEVGLKVWSHLICHEIDVLDEDVAGLLAKGLLAIVLVAEDKYEGLLGEHALLDFAGMLHKSVALLERQEEFARSRLKLQARYHHVLVDEFQDTSRAQWRLIELLVDAWGEGEGAAGEPTSIFIVGDRKQSIYRFRHAEAALLDEAARKIGLLRPGRPVRQAITHSFRAVPGLLAFVNALATEMNSDLDLPDRFSYGDSDRFPVPDVEGRVDVAPVVSLIAQPSMDRAAQAVATEISRLLAAGKVRDRSGAMRDARPDDIAILFRARTGHQYFEDALESRGIRTYVYKGLGFFDAPEVQDLQALVRFLAQPDSNLRAAELLRSRIVRISDVGLAALAPEFSRALTAPDFEPAAVELDDLDRAMLIHARTSVSGWLARLDRVTPGELVDLVLRDAAYSFEMRGRRAEQARENVKKVRALIRRVESRGYTTMGRLAEYFDSLRTGDESNAVVEAEGCVNLMTIHAAKGLEFPIVFVVNMHMPGRGRSPGFSVIERGPNDEPEVAFGTTEATKLEDQRETEELRRLLYVAVTRARDRLYLASDVEEGAKVRRGARSLASLLPATLGATFAAASATDLDRIEWTSASGPFTLGVCRPGPSAVTSAGAVGPDTTVLDVEPIEDARTRSRSVTGSEVFSTGDLRPHHLRPRQLAGTLVHRLFQRQVDPSLGEDAIARLVLDLARPEELADEVDSMGLAAEVASAYRRFRSRTDVATLLAAGECHYEVPFSFEPAGGPGETVRGAFDCLILGTNGEATVLEFKTGVPRPEHAVQAALYGEALRRLAPGRRTDVKILYP
jgi:ATP-dependent helicase/nuclease subunit A